MPVSNWACPICQAAHLQTITYVEDIVLTHVREHYGPGGSNATAQLCSDGEWRVFRDGNGNRWVNREPWVNVADGTEVDAPMPDPEATGDERPLKLEDFFASLPEPEPLSKEEMLKVAREFAESLDFNDKCSNPDGCDSLHDGDICRSKWELEPKFREAYDALNPDVDLDPMTGEDLDAGQGVPDTRTDVYGSEERITDEAWRLVMGDRQSSYNHPASDFEATGRMWGAILTNWLQSRGLMVVSDGTKHDVDFSSSTVPDIDPRIVALMIAMVKVSRESHKHKHDNLVDLIGYALCADRIERDY